MQFNKLVLKYSYLTKNIFTLHYMTDQLKLLMEIIGLYCENQLNINYG
jgi:hypothetical protein